MKNKLFLIISVIMVCSLCACGKQATGTMTNTGNSTEQVVASEDNSEQTTAENGMDDSNSSTEESENKDNWSEAEELVNRRGDVITVYLLEDGRYMDRSNTVYIYDGIDTWTDESGVEWNKIVK